MQLLACVPHLKNRKFRSCKIGGRWRIVSTVHVSIRPEEELWRLRECPVWRWRDFSARNAVLGTMFLAPE